MSALLRRWFVEFGPISRSIYLRDGAALMAAKYLIDALFIKMVSGAWWTPLDYLSPGITLREEKLALVPAWALVVLAAWCLPFIWVGMSYSLRRCIDAGRSPWIALWFFVPIANYLMMLLLSVAPSRPAEQELARVRLDEARDKWRSAGVAAAATIGLGVLFIWMSTILAASYGTSLFLAMPTLLGFLAGWIYNREGARPAGETVGVVLTAMLVLGLVLLLFAWEGVVCLVLALPLSIPLAVMGGVLGRGFAGVGTPRGAVAGMLLLPVGLAVDVGLPPATPAREILTTIEIDAPVERVWESVISFPELAPPTEPIFRAGVAYPVRARIEGTGVGAIRYCEFSTGSFVEPITVWEPGHRLAFSVSEQPEPLRELSPYRHITPAHLNSGFRSERGEFLLVPLPDGRTRLEGRTWYHTGLAPAAYWTPITDAMIHTIHLRVLRHVAALSESER